MIYARSARSANAKLLFLCVLFPVFGAGSAQSKDKATPTEISEQMEYIAYEATCADVLPIISGPMRPGMIDENQFDALTAMLPVFIYGYAMASEQSFDAVRFELIDACNEAPDRLFAGFPDYRPDPRFWPQEFINVWNKNHE